MTAAESSTCKPGLFIAGTDTGVGKTTVAVALLRCARNQGRRWIPFKPAETGCSPEPTDTLRLWQAGQPPLPAADLCLYALPLPAAPQAAARAVGISISLESIVDRAEHLQALGDGILVESAGGLLAPYGPSLAGADIAAALHLPILLVASTRLGTINHVALTVNEIRRRRLPLAGLLLVETSPDRLPHEVSNVGLIEEVSAIRPFGVLPYLATTDPEELATALTFAVGADAIRALLGRPKRPLSGR